MRKRLVIVLTSNGTNEKYKRHSVVDRRLIKKLNRKGLLVKIDDSNICTPLRSMIVMEKYNTVQLYGLIYMMFLNKEEYRKYERIMLKYKLSS